MEGKIVLEYDIKFKCTDLANGICWFGFGMGEKGAETL